MKTALAFLLLLSFAPLQKIAAQNLTSNIPYADPAHERQVLDIYAPDDAKDLPVVFWIHGGGWQTGDSHQRWMHAQIPEGPQCHDKRPDRASTLS